MKRETKPEATTATTEITEGTILTPVKAIRAHCLHCCGYSTKEVKLCTVTSCSLYPYRMGHSPARKGKGGMGKRKQYENKSLE